MGVEFGAAQLAVEGVDLVVFGEALHEYADNPGMVVVALGALIQQYCYGRDPKCGAVLAAAAHERSVEIWEMGPDHGLIATTLSGFAVSHVKALTLLGASEQVLEETQHYIQFYEGLEEYENLPSLKVLRIEAFVNLQRIDEADSMLQDESLLRHPIVGKVRSSEGRSTMIHLFEPPRA